MKQIRNPLIATLLISLLLLAAGLYMTIDSYYKRLSIDLACSQAAFFRTMPHLITKGETLKIPVYLGNNPMENNPFINGEVSCLKGGGKISIKELRIDIYRRPFSKISFTTLLDARVRK